MVIGVAKEQGSVFGQSRDRFAIIPAETYFKMFGSRTGIGDAAPAMDREQLEQARDEVRSLLRAWRHVRPGDGASGDGGFRGSAGRLGKCGGGKGRRHSAGGVGIAGEFAPIMAGGDGCCRCRHAT